MTEPATIAVAIPCFNEAPAIGEVIAQWRLACPRAEVVVFDNNSTDGTGEIARGLGVRVVDVHEQGKGHAVRAIFRELAGFDVVILVDGDGTYPADMAAELVEPLIREHADMTVGARRPVADAGAMSPVRGLGNVLIRSAFAVLIGSGPGDLLSGYRAFTRKAREQLTLRASGFEIEAEIACGAVARGFRVIEIPVPYFKRIAGTVSKLNAGRDGIRILATIVSRSLRLRPWRILSLIAIFPGLASLFLRAWQPGAAALALGGFALALWIGRNRPKRNDT